MKLRSLNTRGLTAPLLFITVASSMAIANRAAAESLFDLDIEELLKIEVTSASKKAESLNSVAAAIFVISQNDIRQSGVTSIPEALRLAPGIQVARIDSNKWAISSRGFNGRFSNKLLVMIDGRSIYTPTFSGVYWEMQHVPLEDIDRIEVIRGPGGSVWGANAVNGVISIITKHAADTAKSFIRVGKGDKEKTAINARLGSEFGDNGFGRLTLSASDHDSFSFTDGSDSKGNWEHLQIAGRYDKQLTHADNISLTADYRKGDIEQEINYASLTPPYNLSNFSEVTFDNWHALAQWKHNASQSNLWDVQLYIDHYDRKEFILHNEFTTYNLDLTHTFQVNRFHDIVWGTGYRLMELSLESTPVVTFQKEDRTQELFSFFIQDSISFNDDLTLTIGAKWEYHDYSGDEFQPSIKINWTPSKSSQLWASIAKAVRTPSIYEKEAVINITTVPPSCASSPETFCPPASNLPLLASSEPSLDLKPEELTAFELGYRRNVGSSINLDVSFFYNEYSQLRSFSTKTLELRATPILHLFAGNDWKNSNYGNTHGTEIAIAWAATNQLIFDLTYSHIETDINYANYLDTNQNTTAPKNQLSLRTHAKLSSNLEANLWVRFVDEAPVIANIAEETIDAYTAVDMNIAWQITPDTRLRLIGRNLFDSSHLEYIQEIFIAPTEIQRSILAEVTHEF